MRCKLISVSIELYAKDIQDMKYVLDSIDYEKCDYDTSVRLCAGL